MNTYFFNVTLKIEYEGDSAYTSLYRGCRAHSEHEARRRILQGFLEDGKRVVAMEYTDRPDRDYGLLRKRRDEKQK